MSRKAGVFVALFLVLSMVTIFSMNYVFGLGYSPSRSWVINLGAMNGFSDELFVNVFTAASTSQSTVYQISAHVPILGRSEKNSGFRLGPLFDTIISSATTFNLGIYGQYYIGPWRLEMSVYRSINKSNFSTSIGLWYFFSSQSHHFIDYFVADIEANEKLPYFSLIFIEPF